MVVSRSRKLWIVFSLRSLCEYSLDEKIAVAACAASSEKSSLAEAYSVLDVESTASNDEVVKAYRRQMSRHHPDKLKANGLPESMLEHAKQRTQQIIEAYEAIKSSRGA